jgi:hypothetical protein
MMDVELNRSALDHLSATTELQAIPRSDRLGGDPDKNNGTRN